MCSTILFQVSRISIGFNYKILPSFIALTSINRPRVKPIIIPILIPTEIPNERSK